MKTQWITAALLSSALVVGCSDRGSENAQNAPENQGTAVNVAPEPGAPTTQAPAPAEQPPVSSNRDSSTFRPDTSGARSTSGNRSAASRPPAPASRVDAAPRPSERIEPRAPSRAAEPAPRVTVRTVTIPAGTALPLELTTAVSTETASVEMPVSARLRRAVAVDGTTVLPAGAIVNGEVIEVDRPGRVQGRARLGLRFTSVTVDGRREDLRSNPVMFEGESTKGEDATKIGAGAGIGAIVGGIVGGGDGAAKGAAIGGAAGTGAVLATRGRDVSLQPGADINATLASAVDIEVR
jgi:hypothetical protein